MITRRYHRDFPFGKKFDTEGIEYPKPPVGGGWVEDREELYKTMTTEDIVRASTLEAIRQCGPDRYLLDLEHRKKFGFEPPALATNAEVENVMSNRTPDGKEKIAPPKSAHFSRRFMEG